ncbi:Asp23/Gls24 family envelope stress response protein [Acidaminococcus timonensis]|uniref:Asp23/Gls24 family envelope stress response protein n=1 Tax=Acidaminococcus timonensis TaxID=1871002 RepID=UPI0026EF6C28|nr:Asp23/Gls24 family envelope stress response protein [Acidaminococcus timonensis]
MIQGKTIICEEVFMQLVRLAAEKVENVSLCESGSGGLMGFAKGLTGKNVPTIGVEKTDAEVDENGTVTRGHVSFTLKVSVACDANIPEAIENLREAVVTEVVKITDFVVDKVDIIVARLNELAKKAEPETKPEEQVDKEEKGV